MSSDAFIKNKPLFSEHFPDQEGVAVVRLPVLELPQGKYDLQSKITNISDLFKGKMGK